MIGEIEQLAIFGGEPTFTTPLYVGRPNIGNKEQFLEYANTILDRHWLTNNGLFVKMLEEKLCDYLGVKHCIPVCNATIGLEIASKALGLKNEIIVPSFTATATVDAIEWIGLTPVFCDVDSGTHNIDPRLAEKLITPQTSAILGVHLWGRPCDIYSLSEIAERRGIKLFFDAAHAFGCSYNGKKIGRFGSAEVFSFHATKFFNTFEGGAIATNDDLLAERIRHMKNFGFAGHDNVVSEGTNGKMSEICAAMGIVNLSSVSDVIEVNYRHYQHYKHLLSSINGIKMISYNETEKNNYQYIVVEVDDGRDALINILTAENVLARRYFYPGCHKSTPYNTGLVLPNTENLANRTLVLPTGINVLDSDVENICRIIKFYIDNVDKINTLPLLA